MDKKKTKFLELKKKLEEFLTKDHFKNTPYQHLNYWNVFSNLKKEDEK